MKGYPLQTAFTIVAVVLMLSAAHRVDPSIDALPFRNLIRSTGFWKDGAIESPPRPQAVHRPLSRTVKLLDDEDGVLDHFYQALSATQYGEVARVVHYGDSPTTADLITGDVRSLLQKHFGNAGHGFVLLDQPWAWYQHYDVKLLSFGWNASPATRVRVADGYYGLGGVSFTATAPARTHYSFAGRPQSRFEISFLRQPGGGMISLSSGGETFAEVDTAADAPAAGFATIDTNPPLSEIDVRVDSGQVRAFGLVAETGAPGVVYDSLGLNGATTSVLARTFNQSHWADQLRHRNPDLVVINYGTNEADFGHFIETEYGTELRQAIRRVHSALPKASVLIMSPMDRGYWASSGEIETLPTIPRIVEIQRQVASDTQCGFFDTFDAMGGEGTIARWHDLQPPLIGEDLIHPHSTGAKMIGSALLKEILVGFQRFKDRQIAREAIASGIPR